jgi:DinB superfamily
MANTRKVLERVPEDKLDWQVHPKSHTIGWNANHLPEILGWVEGILTAPSWDFAPAGGEPYQCPKLTSRQEILDLFDRNVAAARKAIVAVKDDQPKRSRAGATACVPRSACQPDYRMGTRARRTPRSMLRPIGVNLK